MLLRVRSLTLLVDAGVLQVYICGRGAGGSTCLTAGSSGTTFSVVSSAYSASANDGNVQFNDFTGYMAIFTGCKYGVCLEHNYPIEASLIRRELSSWSFDFSSSGKYDATYDMFFNKTIAPGKVPTGGEVMIWLNHHNVDLGGPQLPDVTIGGIQWHVFSASRTTPTGNWNRIAFERVVPTSAVRDLDIALFIQAAMTDGAIAPDWYQQELEAGFEIWSGGVGLTTNSFAAGEPNAGLTANALHP